MIYRVRTGLETLSQLPGKFTVHSVWLAGCESGLQRTVTWSDTVPLALDYQTCCQVTRGGMPIPVVHCVPAVRELWMPAAVTALGFLNMRSRGSVGCSCRVVNVS